MSSERSAQEQATLTNPMEDAEAVECDAEAVLLALGQRLEWLNFRDYSLAEVGDLSWYVAGKNGNGWATWTGKGGDQDGPFALFCTSLTAAKAACEHHHATGKWE